MTRKEFEIPPEHLDEAMEFLSKLAGVIDLNPNARGVLNDVKPEVEKFLEEYRRILQLAVAFISTEAAEDAYTPLFREVMMDDRLANRIPESDVYELYQDFKKIMIDLFTSHLTAEPNYLQGTTNLREMKFPSSPLTPTHVRILIERYGLQGEEGKSLKEISELLAYTKANSLGTLYNNAHGYLTKLVSNHYHRKKRKKED